MKRVTTTCPMCRTTFRVSPVQLAARAGEVRCGQCGAVFNGLEMLALKDAAAGTSAHEGELANEPERNDIAHVRSAPNSDAPKSRPNVAHDTRSARSPRPDMPASVEATDARQALRAHALQAAALYPRAELAADTPHRTLWRTGSIFLSLTLTAQTAYQLRDPLARVYPQMRPGLEALCNVLSCEVKLPRDAGQLSIESSDLQQQPGRESEVVLVAALRNHAPYAQAYPALELTLTGTQDQALVRRVLRPADYLEPKRKESNGMAANAEINIQARFEVVDVRPVGYRLFLFYP